MKAAIASVSLLLVACTSSPPGDQKGAARREQAIPATKVDYQDPATRAQALRLLYSRDGTWQPVKTVGDPALLSRDKYGSRLLILRKTAGYDVFQLDQGCSRKGAYSLHRGRGAERDDLPPSVNSPNPGYLDLSAEMRRICAQKRPQGREMSLAAAVTAMRGLADRDTLAGRPQISDADRKAAMEVMARHRAGGAR